jgi:carbon storage regulator CsrA
MLVLSRRPDEKILLPSVPAVIKVISSQAGVVRLGIEAPSHVPILRAELHQQDRAPEKDAAEAAPNPRHAVRNRLHNLGLGLALLRMQLAECDPEVRQTLDGMEEEIQALRRALAGAAEASGPAGEPLAAQPTA